MSTTRTAERTGITRLLNALSEAGIFCATSRPRKARSRRSSSIWCRRTRHELARVWCHLSLRDGAHLPHAGAERGLAGALDLALFRRVRRGHRLRIDEVEGVSYGAFIVPGLIMLTVMTQSVSNAAFGIYFPKFIGTIYELLSAPVSFSRS
jgi:ABC-type multidrug transport system permease subunit